MAKVYGFKKTSSNFEETIRELMSVNVKLTKLLDSLELTEYNVRKAFLYDVESNLLSPTDEKWPNFPKVNVNVYETVYRADDNSFSISWRYNKDDFFKGILTYEFIYTFMPPRNRFGNNSVADTIANITRLGWEKYEIVSRYRKNRKTSEQTVVATEVVPDEVAKEVAFESDTVESTEYECLDSTETEVSEKE